MLWFWRTKSLNCSAWQIEQHRSHPNYQRRCHCRPKNVRWNVSSPPKIGIGRSSTLLTRCRWSSMVQGPSHGSEGLWASSQDHGWGHCPRYSIHPGTNEKYQNLKKNFWWTRMKQEIAKYVSECDTCWRVKANHLRPTGNLQPLSTPEWKWENICMDFIVGLPHTSRGYNSIWVIVDHLTKSANFIPIATTYRVR
jgi:hypothetical protein